MRNSFWLWRRVCCWVICGALGMGGGAWGQVIQRNVADPAVDQARLARIDTLIQGYVDKGWVNGVVTLVIHDGHVVQYKGYGYADREAGKAMKPDDLFRIASQTKAIVSVGLMRLWEQGKFFLDEPIADFLPAFRHPVVLDKFNGADTTYTTVAAKRDITFRDLLTHTSGLDYPGIGSPSMKAIYAKAGIPSGLGVVDYDLRERMEALAKLPLVHQPGEKWTYGLSVDLIGCLIEVISGMSLEDYLRATVLGPLGMKDTWFNVPAERAGRLTTVYWEDSLHHVVRWTKEKTMIDPEYPLAHKRYFSGGAGLTSTAWDYAIFLQMLLNGGKYNGVQILAPRTVQLMTSGQLSFLFNGSDNFGLGFEITSAQSAARGVRNEGSFSWGGFFGTTDWADPKAKLVCLVMTQQTPNSHADMEGRVEQLIYQSFVK
jgi:CubicO group peptidase (beta-lactamase class C family)